MVKYGIFFVLMCVVSHFEDLKKILCVPSISVYPEWNAPDIWWEVDRRMVQLILYTTTPAELEPAIFWSESQTPYPLGHEPVINNKIALPHNCHLYLVMSIVRISESFIESNLFKLSNDSFRYRLRMSFTIASLALCDLKLSWTQ